MMGEQIAFRFKTSWGEHYVVEVVQGPSTYRGYVNDAEGTYCLGSYDAGFTWWTSPERAARNALAAHFKDNVWIIECT